MSQTILPPSEPSSLGQAPWTSLCFDLPADQTETLGPQASPLLTRSSEFTQEKAAIPHLCSLTCSSKLQSHWNQPDCLGPHTPLLWQLQLSPNPQDAVPDATSEQREGEKKCHSSMTSCSNHTAQTPSALDHGPLEPPPFGWVEGNSAHLEPSPKARPPARPAHPARQQCPIPAGRRLLPVPTTLSNSPLGLQPEHGSPFCSKAQRDLKPSQRPPAWHFSKGPSTERS